MYIAVPTKIRPSLVVKIIDDVNKNRTGKFVCKKVSDRLYRGAKPEKAYDKLAAKGIKAILDLRSLNKRKVANAAQSAACHGFRYKNLPLNPFHAEKYYQDVTRELNQISSENPVFVHCEFGKDRTGFVCAIENIIKNGYTLEEALKDMYDNGFRKFFISLDKTLKRHFS